MAALGDTPAAGARAEQTTRSRRADSDNDEDREEARLLREGTKIQDQIGHFFMVSGGAEFRTSDGHALTALPNLGLERILETLKLSEQPEKMRWSVSGVVTEFDRKNYILVSRAVYKSRLPRQK